MNTSPYLKKYQQAAVQTSSGPQLLLMLYDGAIKFVRSGIEGIQEKNLEKANSNFLKAQNIVHELIAALNFDYEVSKNLAMIYEYMLHLLIQANMRKSEAPANEAIGHLQELREAWRQIAKTASAEVSTS